jgi:tRNA(Ile)-lysidine synthase
MLSKSPFIESLNSFLLGNKLIREGEKIVVAISGGIDSMVLFKSLFQLRDQRKINLVIAHFNHQLRGKESDEDEDFVRKYAKEHGVDCYIERANTALTAETQKISIQEAARNLRYAFFTKIRTSIGFSKIATGHNADDNCETILLNVFRGAGVHGLRGIPIYRSDTGIIRPLLFATRHDIELYALENHIPYRVDSSNLKADYTRNFLRLNILPVIKENINPNISATLQRTSQLFNELDQYLTGEAKQLFEDVVVTNSPDELSINLEIFHSHPIFLQEYILFTLAKEFTKQEIGFSNVRALHKTTLSESGSYCSLRMDIVFYKDRNQAFFKKVKHVPPFRYDVEINKEYHFENFYFNSKIETETKINNNPNEELIDADLVTGKLLLRNWTDGDWFFPFGMDCKKKLSDLFIDEKIPIFKKATIPILESNGSIIWVCGIRLDDRFKITPQTKNVIKLSYKSNA